MSNDPYFRTDMSGTRQGQNKESNGPLNELIYKWRPFKWGKTKHLDVFWGLLLIENLKGKIMCCYTLRIMGLKFVTDF